MAAEATLSKKSLVIRAKVGINQEGKDVFKTLSFSKIKSAATDDQLFAIGSAVAGLMECISYSINKEEDYGLAQA